MEFQTMIGFKLLKWIGSKLYWAFKVFYRGSKAAILKAYQERITLLLIAILVTISTQTLLPPLASCSKFAGERIGLFYQYNVTPDLECMELERLALEEQYKQELNLAKLNGKIELEQTRMDVQAKVNEAHSQGQFMVESARINGIVNILKENLPLYLQLKEYGALDPLVKEALEIRVSEPTQIVSDQKVNP